MKKTVAILICLLMVVSTLISVFAADGDVATFTVKTDKATVSRGDVINVSVDLGNCDLAKAVGFQFKSLTDKFEVLDAAWVGTMAQGNGGSALIANVALDVQSAVSTLSADTKVDGTVFTIKLKVKDNADFGDAEIAVTVTRFKIGSADLEFDVIPATVNIACTHANATSTTTDATCAQKGSVDYTCPDCGATWSEEIAIDANAHAWDAGVAHAPTCTEAGYTVYTCTNDASHTKTEAGAAATGHTWGTEVTVVTAPTCGVAGVGTVKCVNCDATNEVAIPATGEHTAAEEAKDVEATCEEPGYKGAIVCTVCGTVLNADEIEEIPALGHDWVKGETVEPTADEGGYTEYVCARCDAKMMGDVVPPLGAASNDETTKADDSAKADETTKAEETKKPAAANQVPAGGDNMIFAVVILAVVACASGAIIVVRRKKEDQ